MTAFRETKDDVDFCVVGGGMAGLCAALAATRHGARVALMHDRPVLGGNASSECRVHIGGADRQNSIKNMRETGILEELRLENLARNPNRNFSIWDTILYEKICENENIRLFLNCSCLDAEMDGSRIRSVTGWQVTTQTYHKVTAAIFADCSGDAVLVPLTGARFRTGREARSEYGESIAPEKADNCTMGMTCLFQAREYSSPQVFEPLPWAYRFDACDELPYGQGGHRWRQMGYWWVELGGEQDSIHGTEEIRHELLRIVYGVWDHIKNRCPQKDEAANLALDWVQFLPAKRENRRYVGVHVLTQNDISSEGRFDDNVAYGGWSMDDHHPAGFGAVKLGAPATIFHPAPSPYGIPYRSLYSRNIRNLMFAGRDASCTHSAMSSTRVMGTGCSMGQAVGTAAAMAIRKDALPADMVSCIGEVQQTLLRDDAYIPWLVQEFSSLTTQSRLAASRGDPEPVRDGINRPVGKKTHSWICGSGDYISYIFDRPERVASVSLVLDSALDEFVTMSYHQKDEQLTRPPDVMPRAFRIEGLAGDQWRGLVHVDNNHQRLVRVKINKELNGIRFVLDSTWGGKPAHVYAFYVD